MKEYIRIDLKGCFLIIIRNEFGIKASLSEGRAGFPNKLSSNNEYQWRHLYSNFT
jgi:hypothetical protein